MNQYQQQAMRTDEVDATIGHNHIPLELFEGFSVYQSLSEEAKTRTSAENVSDVLDAVVKLMRANANITGD